MFKFLSVWLLVAIFFLISCNTEDPVSVQKCDVLTITNPSIATNQSYKVGDNLTISWCFPENWTAASTVVEISVSNSSIPSWTSLTTDPVKVPQNSITTTLKAPGDSCKIRIYDYDKNYYAYTVFFKVTN